MAGGSGFWVGVPSTIMPKVFYKYAVTNRHVIEGGAPVIRLNLSGGRTDVLDLQCSDWVCSRSDDIAVCDLENRTDENKSQVTFLTTDSFVTGADIQKYGIGPGTEVFMLGRFMSYEGKVQNEPSARFGKLSIVCSEKIKQIGGHLQDSLLVEMHSIGGYSGSPVFIYVNRYLPGTRSLDEWEWKLWFLGVDWGHLTKREKVFDKNDNRLGYVDINSGLAGVVPCQKLLDLLNEEELVSKRIKNDEILKAEQEHCGMLD